MGGGSDQTFWRHEWSKHGTCAAASSPEMAGLKSYFLQTLQLYDSVPLLQWLKQEKIVPLPAHDRNSYPIKDIHAAIEKHTGGRRVFLECKRISRNDSPDPILTEIRVCFRPQDLEFTDCLSRDDSECGTKNIRFISNRLVAIF